MINGKRFVPPDWAKTYPIDAPYFTKVKDDTRVEVGRNDFIKEYLYLHLFTNNEFRVNVYRIGEEEANRRFRNLGVTRQMHSFISRPDCWL